MYIMVIDNFVMYLRDLVENISSDFFANVLSFLELLIALVAFVMGVDKVSKLIKQYNNQKNSAIFSFHVNLKIYIKRIRKLTTNNKEAPLKTLYLLSPNEKIRCETEGYENLALELCDISHKLLDFLSSKSEQIPATNDYSKIGEWNKLIESLVDILLDFTLLNTGAYLPAFKDIDGINNYHRKLTEVLKKIEEMIDDVESKYIQDLENEQET